jgi:Raf kinase inhibitor-like YbhB/YbcL family protein
MKQAQTMKRWAGSRSFKEREISPFPLGETSALPSEKGLSRAFVAPTKYHPMKIKLLASGLILCTCVALAQPPAQPAAPGAAPRPPATPGLTLTTPDFADGTVIPGKFTQSVPKPVSPRLEWTNVPANTVTFVLIMHDPDTAPQKKSEDILHWMAFNIPGTARELAEGQPAEANLPDGTIQTKNTRGAVGFLGPGAGAAGPYHHYTWELYALDLKLELTPDATRADVLKAIDGHVLAKAATVGRFHR